MSARDMDQARASNVDDQSARDARWKKAQNNLRNKLAFVDAMKRVNALSVEPTNYAIKTDELPRKKDKTDKRDEWAADIRRVKSERAANQK